MTSSEPFPNNQTIKMIKCDEGYSPGLYIDSLGFQTIGIGFCLDRIPMPEDVAEFWCQKILNKLDRNMALTPGNIFSIYIAQNPARKSALLNMAYQMGITGLCRFEKMWEALGAEDYEKAAREALDSLWAKQTKKRAKRVAEVIRAGDMNGYKIG